MDNALPIDPVQTHLVLEHKHGRPLVACHWHPQQRFAFWGAQDNLIGRIDLETKSAATFGGHESWVRALGCSPDGTILYSGGYDGRLIWWPALAEAPQPTRTIEAHSGWLRALAVHPSGDRIATCGNDRLVKIWNAADGSLIRELGGHDSHVYNVIWQPDGATLCSCDLKGVVKEWDPETGTLKRDLSAAALWKYDNGFRADIGGARSIAVKADGQEMGLGGITNVSNAFAGIGHAAVVVLDRAEGKQKLLLEAKEKINGVCWGLAWHPQGFWVTLTGGGGGGWLYFFKGDSANEFHKVKLPANGRDLALSPDGRRVTVAGADGLIRVYALHAKAQS